MNFYYVDIEYIKFLQEAEKAARGKTCVPNMDYPGRHQKFLCGPVLILENGIKYYVSVSHYSIQETENILFIEPKDKEPIKGSMRFNYMIPVPDKTLSPVVINQFSDYKYKKLVSKKFIFIQKNEKMILNKAKEVYEKIKNKRCAKKLIWNSCDFQLLEEKFFDFLITAL